MNQSPQIGILLFLIGVFCADIIRTPSVLLGSIFTIGILLLFFQNKIRPIIWGTFGFLIGSIFLLWNIPTPENLPFTEIANQEQEISIEGIIISFPQQKEKKIIFDFEIHKKEKTENKIQKIQVSSYGIKNLHYGQTLKISGKIVRPKPFEGFAYDRFMAKENIFAIMPNAKIFPSEKAISLSYWQEFWKTLFFVREKIEWNIRNTIPFPESEYALGIILGADSGIPKNIIEEFRISGLLHLLALSGFNITIILTIVFWALQRLPRFWKLTIALGLIFIFVGITGASSSVVRAAVMGGVGAIALQIGRKQNILWILTLSLFAITIQNPFLLFSDPSLQLSVLAVLGLIFIYPIIQKHWNPFLKKLFPSIIVETFGATLAAQVFTIPFMIYSFHQISLISPFANILVVPITSFAMLFSGLCTVPYIGIFAMPFAYILLHFSLWIAHLFANIPNAQISLSAISPWHLVWMYGIIFLYYWWYYKEINILKTFLK